MAKKQVKAEKEQLRVIGFYIPAGIEDKFKYLAEKKVRSVSNYILYLLKKDLKERNISPFCDPLPEQKREEDTILYKEKKSGASLPINVIEAYKDILKKEKRSFGKQILYLMDNEIIENEIMENKAKKHENTTTAEVIKSAEKKIVDAKRRILEAERKILEAEKKVEKAEARAKKADERAEKATASAEKRAEKAEKKAEKAEEKAEKGAKKADERARKADEGAKKADEKTENIRKYLKKSMTLLSDL